jgi:hypothetical protein
MRATALAATNQCVKVHRSSVPGSFFYDYSIFQRISKANSQLAPLGINGLKMLVL